MQEERKMKRAGITAVAVSGGILALNIAFFEGKERSDVTISDKRITFISPMAADGYWEIIADGIQEAAQEKDMDVKCIGFSELDQELLIRYIREAILTQTDGIITAGMEDTGEMRQVLEEAKAAGIPVVLVDSDLPGSEKLCYVGTDNYEAGRKAGEDMVQACEGSGNILCLVSHQDTDNQKQRMEGFCDVIETQRNMKIQEILEGRSNEIYLEKRVIEALEMHPEINAVFCAEGFGVEAMLDLIKNFPEQYSSLKVVAFDIDNDDVGQAVQDGIVYSCIQQDPRAMGCQAAQALASYIEDGKKDFDNEYTQSISIRKDNREQILDYSSGEVKWHIYENR